LTAKHHESDFSNGLEEWTVFKQFGPITYWWRDRVAGPQLKDHPFENGKKVLHIRRPDDKDPDGAVWNFPNGLSGNLHSAFSSKKGLKEVAFPLLTVFSIHPTITENGLQCFTCR